MTYLELVNSVLTRLREPQVTLINETVESALIGSFINEAREWVEDSHNWILLRSTIQLVTSPGSFSFSLTGAGNRSNILQLINDTSDYEFPRAPHSWRNLNKLLTANNLVNSEPYLWGLNGVDGSGDPVLNIYPKSDGVYTINVNLIIPQSPFTVGTEEITVPSLPVILYAYALALEERGEEGGNSVGISFARASKALGNSISIDASNLEDEFTWRVE